MSIDRDQFVDDNEYTADDKSINVMEAMKRLGYSHKSAVYRDLESGRLKGYRKHAQRGVMVFIKSIDQLSQMKISEGY